MFSRSIINNSRRSIDDSRVMFQLVAPFMIVTYDHHILIIQATGVLNLSAAGAWTIKLFMAVICGFTK
jgi:hypothetical protein